MARNEPLAPLSSKPAGSYRVLHTADWHLGKMLGEHSRQEEHQLFLEFLLKCILAHEVDALVIAGDVFDSANPPQSAINQYFDFLADLFEFSDCSVVLISGNHDSPAHLEAPRKALKRLRTHIVGTLPVSPEKALVVLPSTQNPQLVIAAVPFLRDRDLRVGQTGQGMLEIQKELVAGITNRYREVAEAAQTWRGKGLPVLATGHLTVVNCSPTDSEREIHIGGQGAISPDCFPDAFDYVALGHLHRPQLAGRETIRYSGSPIPLSFSEATDGKELRVLDFGEGRLLQQSVLPIPLPRALVQLRTERQKLGAELKMFTPPESALRAWVEVLVENPIPGEDLYETVQALVKDREFDVIRVAAARSNAPATLTTDGHISPEEVQFLLSDPANVFARRMETETAFTAEERTALHGAFSELCNLHAEQKREAHVLIPIVDGGAA
ncbi:MAG: Nuclease SbcCD subunit [Verrucomicrobiales bacterium]|nr:Nuclease SbcCD subunit [Verrucomicrobiales bacterium]